MNVTFVKDKFNCKYLYSKDIYQLIKEYPNSVNYTISNLETLIEGEEENDIITVNFVAIEYKDDNGVNLYMDCFEISNLSEDSFDTVIHQLSHLVNQVIKCRKDHIDLSTLNLI